jgi:Fe2+ transport system protein B
MSFREQAIVALAGNPNTGKSTVFNALTGLNQHTGNWPGKTVLQSTGTYSYRDKQFKIVDLPGTYSLLANSPEEQVARDFLYFGNPDVTVVVADATCLERNLNLILQVLEITGNTVVCLNLMDEATRKGISVDIKKLSRLLGVPVVPAVARERIGLIELQEEILNLAQSENNKQYHIDYGIEIEEAIEQMEEKLSMILEKTGNTRWLALRLLDGDPVVAKSLPHYLNRNKVAAAWDRGERICQVRS